jgi:hypothetical protein
VHRLSRQEGLTRAAGLALALVLAAPAWAAEEVSAAYVNTTALNLRASPGGSGAKLGILLLYDPLIVLDQKQVGGDTWYNVEGGGGYTEGWVSGRYVAFGEAPPGSIAAFDGSYGEPRTPTLQSGEFQYVGTQACRECHEEPTGDFDKGAVAVWDGHDHSEAWHTLQRDYTREIARTRRGVEEPASDWRCIKCHVTAYGADPTQLAPTYEEQEGVTCEACHGPGSGYAQEDHGPSNPDRAALGFRIARDLEERNELCTSCHNPASPTYKPFNLREYSRSIAHWVDRGDQAYYAAFQREAERRRARVEARHEQAVREEAGAELAAATPAPEAAPEAPTATPPMTTVDVAPVMPEAGTAATPAPPAPETPEMAAPETPETAAPETAAAETPAPEAPEAAQTPPMQAPEPEAPAPAVPEKTEEAVEVATLGEEQQSQAQKIALEAARLRLEQQAEAEQEQRKQEAEQALARQKEHEQEQAAARHQVEQKARKAAGSSSGVERWLKEVDDTLILNKDGEKKQTVKFSHLAHASKDYVPGIECSTCHHTLEGDEKPEGCHNCHDVGGDADETKKKTKATHSKQHPYPKEVGQEQVSCYGCHKAQNALLEAGKRKGDVAPTKCTACHAKKAR